MIKFAFIGGFIALVGLIILGSVIHERRRRAALARAAEDLGFSYDRGGTPKCRSLASVELFQRGRSRRSVNLVAGLIEERVRTLFTDERLRFFEGFPDKLAIEGGGEWILIYRQRQRTKPDKLSALMETAFEVSAQFDEGPR